MIEPPSLRALNLVPSAALVSCLIGILDFLIFELSSDSARIVEYVFYKPATLALSLLSTQLLIFTALCVPIVLVLLLVTSRVRRIPDEFESSISLVLTTISISVLVVAVRMYWHPRFSLRLVSFIFCCSLCVGFLFLRARTRRRIAASIDGRFSPLRCTPLLIVVVMILIAFLAPDVYSLILRTRPTTLCAGPSRPNVLLIVMDTVRADHLSCYGYERPASPNIDRVATDGLLFLNAYAAAPWTLPSHASIFTGLYPSQHNATWAHPRLESEALTIAERMLDIGYTTVGFSENPFVSDSYGLAQGFNEFHETWRRPLVARVLQRIVERVLPAKTRFEYSKRTSRLLQRWVANHRTDGRPFLAFVNLMTAHHPRYPRRGYGPHEWREDDLKRIEQVNRVPERYYLPAYNLNDRELATMRNVYDSEIAYLDAQIGGVIRYLADHNVLDSTITILTSDHGENFGEHGFIEHQFCLYNSLIRVPLIIRYPPRISSGIVDENVSLVSLFNTILDLVGNPSVTAERNLPVSVLEDPLIDEPIFAEFSNAADMLENVIGYETPDFDFTPFDRDLRCIISGGDKFIWSSNGEHEMYSLQNDADETEDLYEIDIGRARKLGAVLESWHTTHRTAPVTEERPDIDNGTREALRALGYER